MDLTQITNAITEIQKHVTVLNDDYTELTKIAWDNRMLIMEIKNDVSWLKSFFWLITGGVVAQLIAQFYNYKKIRNNNKKDN